MKSKKSPVVKTPKVGDTIYIPTLMYIDHGEDDIAGGRATVSRVYKDMSGGDPNCVFVELKEVKNAYNWTQFLSKDQERLKKQYGRRRAKPDPDYGGNTGGQWS